MITKEIKSIKIDWSSDTIEILEEFNPLEDLGILRINEDGTKELDIYYKSTIYKDKMISDVIEFVKPSDNFGWIRKSGSALSGRYINNVMTLDDSTYCHVTRDENNVVISFTESVDNEHLNEDGSVKEGWEKTFTFFKANTNIIGLMANTMMNR